MQKVKYMILNLFLHFTQRNFCMHRHLDKKINMKWHITMNKHYKIEEFPFSNPLARKKNSLHKYTQVYTNIQF